MLKNYSFANDEEKSELITEINEKILKLEH